MGDTTPTQPAKTNRVKTIISRVKSFIKKRLSKSSKSPAPSTEAQSKPSQPAAQNPVKSSSTPPIPSDTTPNQPTTTNRIAFRTTVDKEKVQALFAKYGLEFDGDTVLVSALDKPGHRVQKPIRMRVRRECHQCHSTFSRSLSCTKCDHRYCRECKRYPPKKLRDKNKAKSISGTQEGEVPAGPA